MSALPSRNPCSLQLTINTEFVSPVRSSAIYTLKRMCFSSLNTNVKRPDLMEDTSGENAQSSLTHPASLW